MAKDFTAELHDFVESVRELGEGDVTLARIENCFQELVEAAGRLLDDLDEENPEERTRLKAQLLSYLTGRVAEISTLRRIVKLGIQSALPSVVPMAVDAAAEHADIAVLARDRFIVAGIDFGINSLLRMRRGVAPDAGPLLIPAELINGVDFIEPGGAVAVPTNPPAGSGGAGNWRSGGRTVQRPAANLGDRAEPGDAGAAGA